MLGRRLLTSLLTLQLILMLATAHDASAAGGKSTGNAGASSDAATNSSGTDQNSAASSSPSSTISQGRVEASMLAYAAMDKIAAHIASQIDDKRDVVIYDTSAFADLKSYEAYATIVDTLEHAYRAYPRPSNSKPPESRQAATGLAAVETVVSTLSTLKSSTDIAAQEVDLSADALIAQLAHHLYSHVLAPKFLLTEPPDQSATTVAPDHGCANPTFPITTQLGCLMTARAGADLSTPDAAAIDHLFQAFFGALMGASTSSATNKNAGGPDIGGLAPPAQPQTAQPPTNQANGLQLLAAVVAGRRLKLHLNPDSHLLVLEVTVAGGASRVRHNFWVELIYATPDPAFNGGAVVTYLLINPVTSVVEKSEALRYMLGYGKFRNAEVVAAPSNF